MGRALQETVEILGIKGINQQERLADPTMELYDARNLWAPDGRLEKRPGFWGVGYASIAESGGVIATKNILIETPLGTFTDTNTLDNLGVGKRWYWGVDTAPYGNEVGFGFDLGSINANGMVALCEYWNGTSWARLDIVEANLADTTVFGVSAAHLSSANPLNSVFFGVPLPNDWALSTISGGSMYWLRFTLQAVNGSSALTAATAINSSYYRANDVSGVYSFAIWFAVAQFPTTSRYVAANGRTTQVISNSGQLAGPSTSEINLSFTGVVWEPVSKPPVVAVVPQFDEFYIVYGGQTTVHKARVLASADIAAIATVETDSVFIGANQDYDPAFVQQLATWPKAKFLVYHRGEMWAANLADGGDNNIRWSAGAPAYKVWPTISIETLSDTDNSPVAAIYPYDQDMMAFKNDSIWRMVYTGLNGLKLNTYRAEKIVSGTGCVAQTSIQNVNGHLVLLAEDGVYGFDGVKANKLSSRIQKVLDSIVPGRREFVSSVHWKKKSCYLLAITTSGSSVNNLVLVWDYKNDSWWVWDGLEVKQFFTQEDSADTERIYFMDEAGRIFELGIGNHDYGTAISAYYVSQRLNQANVNQKIRAVTFLGTNHTREIDVEVQPNDQPFLGKDVQTVAFKDSNEKEYGTAQYDVSHYSPERERYAGLGELKSGSWFRLKVSHDLKDHPLQLANTQINVVPTGVRR